MDIIYLHWIDHLHKKNNYLQNNYNGDYMKFLGSPYYKSEHEELIAFEDFIADKRKNTLIPIDEYISEFIISKRAYNSLTRAGFETVGEILWYASLYGDRWSDRIRDFGAITQREVENTFFGDNAPVRYDSNESTRLVYLINILKSDRQVFNKTIRDEIVRYLKMVKLD